MATQKKDKYFDWKCTLVFVYLLLLAACTATQTPIPTQKISIANPAAVFCVEQGFKSEIRAAADGSQSGVCIFPDGSECDEWAFFRNECGPNMPITETANTSAYTGWLEYIDSNYRFKFRYPPNWTAELDLRSDSTTYQHLLWLRAPEKPVADVEMHVAFERINENCGLQRTGIGAGDLVEQGSVIFLGEPTKRIALVLEGKDMEVMYGNTGAFERGTMRFVISLAHVGMERLGLTPELEQIADLIVASFELEK